MKPIQLTFNFEDTKKIDLEEIKITLNEEREPLPWETLEYINKQKNEPKDTP